MAATPNPSKNPVKPLPREWLQKLSAQLAESFNVRERGTSDFYSPEILEWKYFPPNDTDAPRSIMLADDEKILTHIGILFTDFQSTDPAFKPVKAVHTIDWFSSPSAGPAATMLYVTAIRRGPVQYALGCSDLARRILLGFKFKEVMQAPLFHSVLKPGNMKLWRELHGRQPLHRALALMALDWPRNLHNSKPSGSLAISPVKSFSSEISEIISRRRDRFLFTSRDPAALNHLLQHPHKIYSGWHFHAGETLRGFALTSCFDQPCGRMGKVVECFLDEENPDLMANALSLLRHELSAQGAEIVSCYGTRPSTEIALRKARFFRRGRTTLYLRDPDKKLPENLPFHITHIEGDAAYL